MATVAPAPRVSPAPTTADPAPTAPPGSVTLRGVAWATYCQLRDAEENDHLRMSYLDGDLTIMAPALRHDQNSRWLLMIVAAVAEASGIEYEPVGATTLRRADEAGKEADEGFYLGEAARLVRSNSALDLSVDPPPSLAIEVDHTGDSTAALATYARLGVPEVWIYRPDGPSLWFGALVGSTYQSLARSAALTRLTPESVLAAVAARTQGDRGTLGWGIWLREWARGLPDA